MDVNIIRFTAAAIVPEITARDKKLRRLPIAGRLIVLY